MFLLGDDAISPGEMEEVLSRLLWGTFNDAPLELAGVKLVLLLLLLLEYVPAREVWILFTPVEIDTDDGPCIIPYKPCPTLTGAEECLPAPADERFTIKFAPTPISLVEREIPGEVLSFEGNLLLLLLLLLFSPFKFEGGEGEIAEWFGEEFVFCWSFVGFILT